MSSPPPRKPTLNWTRFSSSILGLDSLYFSNGRFELNGRPFSDKLFQHLAGSAGARESRAGSGALKRAAITGSLVRGAGAATRQGDVAQNGSGVSQTGLAQSLKNILYSPLDSSPAANRDGMLRHDEAAKGNIETFTLPKPANDRPGSDIHAFQSDIADHPHNGMRKVLTSLHGSHALAIYSPTPDRHSSS